ITDTTVPPTPDTIALSEAAQSQLESASEFTVVIERSGDGNGASSVNWAVSAGTASLSDDIDLEPLTGSVSWDDGDTGPLSVSIPIINDELDEPDETLSFTLISAQGADLGGLQTSTLTIVDDDEPPVPGTIQFLADTFSVNEDAGSVTLAVSRVGGDDGDITAVVTSVAGSASDNDFEAIQTVLTWSDSDSDNQEFVIPINFDTEAENTESFAVVLGNATPDDSVLGTPAMATVVINDVFNGEPGTVQFVSDTLSVDETDEELTISVSRTGGSDGALSVNFATSAGSATSGEDFASTSGTLTWEDGDGSPKSFTVAIVADSVSEESELFSATLSDATPFGDESIGAPATVEITINNIEPAPEPEPEPAPEPGTVQFVSDTATVDESAGTISVSVARTGGSDGAVSVSYESIEGSAVAGDDFEPISGQLQWADGEDDVRILTIAISVDDLVEVDEQFQVVLNNALPDETVLGEPATLNLTIADDSVAPPGVLAFTTTAVTVAEADSIVELQVSRTEGSAGEVSVGYTTIARSADEADFQATSGRLYWADGDDSLRTIVVPVNRDGLVESEEQFQVALAQAEPFGDSEQLGTALATVSITDSTRLGSLAFASNEVVVVTESQGSVTLAVTRTDGSDGAVSVDYSLVGGSAVLGADVVDQSGTLNWSDQDTEPKTIELQINEDDLVESREQFVVSLSNAQPLGAQQIARAQATVVIIDSTIFEDTSTPPLASLGALDLVVVSGDGQGGLPGDLLEPLVIDVIDQADSDALVSNIPITWRAIPEGSAELLESDRTVSDDMGRTSNRMRIVSRGFLRVVATIDVEPQATSGIASRNLPPPFEVGQGEAVFTVRSGIGPAIGLRANQAAIGNTLDVVCEVLSVRISQQQVVTAEQQDLFETCLEVEARLADDDGLAAALDRLVPEELFALGDSIIDTTDIQVTNIYSRINAIRSGQVDLLDVSGLQFNYYDQSIPGSVIEASQDELSGGSASADESIGESSRIGFFANGSISYGEVEGGENQSDAEIRTSGLTIGADYRASDTTVFGVGFGFVTSKTDFNPDGGSADIDGLNLSLFGTYYEPNKSYIDAVLDFGRNNYDIERRINLPNTPDQFGIGDTTANVQSLTIGAGRDYRHETWEFGPYGRLSILQADIDGYSERAAGSTDGFGSVLNIGSHSVTSSRLAVGGQVAKTISTKRGVFIPQFRAEAEFEREERKDGIQATFQHDPTQTPFTVNGDDRDSSFFNLGIGGSALFPNGRSGFLFYETQLGNDRVTQHWLKLGVRLEF
ncbi:MAG: Calx-beta domain-containing protein, partial [Granulosicoccus sp.]